LTPPALEEVLILLRESDRPKSLGEKIAEALGRPPMPRGLNIRWPGKK